MDQGEKRDPEYGRKAMEHPGFLWRRGQGIREEDRCSDHGWRTFDYGLNNNRGRRSRKGCRQSGYTLCSSSDINGQDSVSCTGNSRSLRQHIYHNRGRAEQQRRNINDHTRKGWLASTPTKASQRLERSGRDQLARPVACFSLWWTLNRPPGTRHTLVSVAR